MNSLTNEENTMLPYIQAAVDKDDFLGLIGEWLETVEDERMKLLRELIFEVRLSEMEMLKDKLYKYGSCLTEKNYFGRKFFEQMVLLVWQIEQ